MSRFRMSHFKFWAHESFSNQFYIEKKFIVTKKYSKTFKSIQVTSIQAKS